MTRKQFTELRAGDRVVMRHEDGVGTFVGYAPATVVIRFGDGQAKHFGLTMAKWCERAVTDVDQVRR